MMPSVVSVPAAPPPPVYPWFDQAPPGLRTRKQLAALGLAPGGPIRARVVWRGGRRSADLFDEREARPKQAATAAQLAGLAAARAKQEQQRCTCGHCGRLRPGRVGKEPCDLCEEDEVQEARSDACERARRLLHLGDQAVILDTETTDLHGQVVEIAIIALSGEVLLCERVNPAAPITAGAKRVHGISEEAVAAAPPFRALLPRVQPLLEGRRVIAYNADHEASVLAAELARSGESTAWFQTIKWRCAMRYYAAFVGEWSDFHGGWRYQPLPGGDHTACGDCRATLRLLQLMAAGNGPSPAIAASTVPHLTLEVG